MRLFWLALFPVLALGGDAERYFLAPSSDLGNPELVRAILHAACDGEVKGNSCSKCPGSDDHAWHLTGLVSGHFRSVSSEEALAGIGECYYPGNANPTALLLGKRNGKWQVLQPILAFPVEHCGRHSLQSGRDYLLCEAYEYERDSSSADRLMSLTMTGDEPNIRSLFIATDTTRACQADNAQLAVMKGVEFRPEKISIAVAYGAFRRTEAQRDRCAAALDDQVSGSGRIAFPRPRQLREYTIDLLFDGSRYAPSAETRSAYAPFREGSAR